jgi:uncharacterized protein
LLIIAVLILFSVNPLKMKIWVTVKPNCKQQKISELTDGSLTIWLKSPPVDGQANRELIKLLAQKYGVAKSQVLIQSGLTGKKKIIEII